MTQQPEEFSDEDETYEDPDFPDLGLDPDEEDGERDD